MTPSGLSVLVLASVWRVSACSGLVLTATVALLAALSAAVSRLLTSSLTSWRQVQSHGRVGTGSVGAR